MAHSHGTQQAGYYLEQLCTVGACGALGVVTILMWQQERLQNILAPAFFGPVLYGGIALIALVIVRAVGLWFEAGQAKLHQHEHHHHDHEPHDGPCEHEAGECDHDHDHAWTPAKYSVLLLPVVLFLLGLPRPGFSAAGIKQMVGNASLESGGPVTAKDGTVLGFRELADAAHFPATREHFEGKTGQLKGMFMRLGNDREFTLFRIKMRCCAADAVPVQVRIISPTNISHIENKQWVKVTGRIGFRKIAGMDKYMPVLLLESADDVQKTEAEASEFDSQ